MTLSKKQFGAPETPTNRGMASSEPRRGENLPPAAPNHQELIQKALNQHPKTIGFAMFTAGLTHLGVSPTPKVLTHLAKLSETDPQQFHELVRRARSQAIGARQTAKESRRGVQR